MLRRTPDGRKVRSVFAVLILAGAVAACAGRGGTIPPRRSAHDLPMPKSQSPALVKPAPMAKTSILPSSAMRPALGRKPDALGPGWGLTPGSASQITAAPDGSLWVLSTQPQDSADKYIWHYVNGVWTNISGQANHIAVAPDGTLYAVNAGGGTYAYNTSTGAWTALGGGACFVTVAADGSVYVLSNAGSGADKAIWHNVKGTWTQVPGAGVAVAASWNSVSYTTPQGTLAADGLYVLNSQGAIYYLNPDNTYVHFNGAASAITSVSGGLYVLAYPLNTSAGSPIYYYNLTSPGWSAVNGSGVSISANASALYVVAATSGAIYVSPISTSIASMSLAVGTAAVPVGMPADVPLTLTLKDAGGNTITGTYSQPIALSDSDTSGATSLSASSITSSSQTVTLHYNGANLASPVTITASTTGVKSATASFAPNKDNVTANGASYTYAETGSEYWAKPANPSPSPTPYVATITETVSTGVWGQPNLMDVRTVESWTSPANISTQTMDSYENWMPTASGANLALMGDTYGRLNGANGQWTGPQSGYILDMIPHASGQAWTANPYGTWSDTIPNLNTVRCTGPSPLPATYTDKGTNNTDGSYVTTYTNTSSDGTCVTNDHYVVNSNGSGTEWYSQTGNTDLVTVIGTPQPSGSGYVIPVTQSGGYPIATPAPGVPATPTPAPTSTTVPDWYPGGAQPSPLVSDKYADEGTASIPAACNVSASIATTGEKIVETYYSLDPFEGYYNETITSYDTPDIGATCVTIDFQYAAYFTTWLSNTYYGTLHRTLYRGLTAASVQTAMRQTHSERAALAKAEAALRTGVMRDVRLESARLRRAAVMSALRMRLHRMR